MIAQLTGRRIVEMVKEDLRISKILERENVSNAVRANGALGGSTNAGCPPGAIAGRVPGVRFGLDDSDRYRREVPTLVDIMPSGRFLMEDYYYAGGLPAVIRALGGTGMLDKDSLTVTGRPSGRTSRTRRTGTPRSSAPGTTRTPAWRHRRAQGHPRGVTVRCETLGGDRGLMQHRRRAVVFEFIEDYKAKIEDEALDVDETCMLVSDCGPKGYPGMAEVGNIGLPPKVLRKGIRDLVGLSMRA